MLALVDEWKNAGVVAAAFTAMVVAARTALGAWRAIKRRLLDGWSAAVDASNTAHLVRYHLGPNRTTTPMHERMRRLEEAHAIEDMPWQPPTA